MGRILTVICLVLLGGCSPAQLGVNRGHIDSLIAQAQKQGKDRIQDDHVVRRDFPLVNSMQDALRVTIPLVVHIESKTANLTADRSEIRTWYLAQIVESLTNNPLPDRTNAPPASMSLPAELGLTSRDGVIIQTFGGLFTESQVTVFSPEIPVPLLTAKTYLVFLRFVENESGRGTRVAQLGLGDGGVFLVDLPADRLIPMAGRENKSFADAIVERCQGRLSRLRDELATP